MPYNKLSFYLRLEITEITQISNKLLIFLSESRRWYRGKWYRTVPGVLFFIKINYFRGTSSEFGVPRVRFKMSREFYY